MRCALDIETDNLNATKIHCICVADLDSEKTWEFWGSGLKNFKAFSKKIKKIVVHNGIEFDLPVLRSLQGVSFPNSSVEDTLVISRLLEYTLEGGHSLEAWGDRLKFKKTGLDITDWSKLTPEMLTRCRGDALLTKRLYFHLLEKAKISYKGAFDKAWEVEHKIAHICRRMKEDGFMYDKATADKMKEEIAKEVAFIDDLLLTAFPPVIKKTQLKTKVKEEIVPFNPSSPKQIVERLKGHWKPVDFTEVGNPKVTEANLATLKDSAPPAAHLLVKRLMLASRVRKFDEWAKAYDEQSGRIHPTFVGIGTWTGRMAHRDPNLGNVAAPKSIKYKGEELKSMATSLGGRMRRLWQATPGNYLVGNSKCIKIELNKTKLTNDTIGTGSSQTQRTLDEEIWLVSTNLLSKTLNLCQQHKGINASCVFNKNRSQSIIVTPQIGYEDSFASLVTRCLGGLKTDEQKYLSISNETGDLVQRSPDNYLVGTDADGIQLRIFAHYINDPKFTEALVRGKSALGTDAHSLNASILGCERDTAKTFIYAFLLGAGDKKLAEILGCSLQEAKKAKQRFIEAYPGLAKLRAERIPQDARRGYFEGFDGRLVKCDSEHHMLAGYLQNGEACIMKHANIMWQERLIYAPFRWWQVNFVHDEFQTEVSGTEDQARFVGQVQADCIKAAGESFSLNCPMAGNFKVGRNWFDTH